MSLEKFDLLISNGLSDKQISELVIDAENDPVLKAAIDGYVTEHILESDKEITPQIELLTQPISYHRQAIQGIPAPSSPPPPGSGANRVLQIMIAVAGVACAIYVFFINPFWQENKSPAIAINQPDIIDTVSKTRQSELPADTQTNSHVPLRSKTIKRPNNEPKFNQPLSIQRFAKADSAIAVIFDNSYDSILKNILSPEELAHFNSTNLISINEDYNNPMHANKSDLNQINPKDSSEKYLPIAIIKEKEKILIGLIKKHSLHNSAIVAKEKMVYRITSAHNNIVVLNGTIKTTSTKFLNYKFLFKVNTENGSSAILYYQFDK